MKNLFRILFLICFFAGVIHFMPSLNDGSCNMLSDFSQTKFEGVVLKKFIDTHEHSFPFIHVKDLKTKSITVLNLSLDTSDFYNKIKLNDTILKNTNSNWIYLKQNGKFIKFKQIDFGCEKP